MNMGRQGLQYLVALANGTYAVAGSLASSNNDFSPFSSAIVNGAYVAILDSTGNWLDLVEADLDPLTGSWIDDLELRPDSSLLVAATFGDSVLVGLQALHSAGGADLFLATLEPQCFTGFFADHVDAGCALGNDGVLDVDPIGGTAPYTYLWDTGAVTDSIGGLLPGVHSVSITDASSCHAEFFTLVEGPDLPATFDLASGVSPYYGCFRSGHYNFIDLPAWNQECLPTSGILSVVLPSGLTYDNASWPLVDMISGDTLRWNFTDLDPVTGWFAPKIRVVAEPWLTVGDTVCLTSIVEPAFGDVDPANNTFTECYPVTNSYDPNDKSVYPRGEGAEGRIAADQQLTYTVQFQNTGNAEAFYVSIVDTLDADLDLASLRILGSSHAMEVDILEDHVLRFRFPEIHLPDSASDETGSHGYLIYSIDPVDGISGGSVIENTAYIYFDLNPPIVTNTVSNMIDIAMSTPLSVERPGDVILLQPNPAIDLVQVTVPETFVGRHYSVFEPSGREVLSGRVTGSTFSVQLGSLASGAYGLRINDRMARLVKR